jgi:hypothetical protein
LGRWGTRRSGENRTLQVKEHRRNSKSKTQAPPTFKKPPWAPRATYMTDGGVSLWFSFSILQLSINSQAYDISIRHSFAARDPRIILTLVVERVSCSRQCQRLRSLSSSNGIRLNHDKILKDWGWSKASIPRRSEELRERKKKTETFSKHGRASRFSRLRPGRTPVA